MWAWDAAELEEGARGGEGSLPAHLKSHLAWEGSRCVQIVPFCELPPILLSFGWLGMANMNERRLGHWGKRIPWLGNEEAGEWIDYNRSAE